MAMENFLKFLNKIYGLFLDASAAFPLYANQYSKKQKALSRLSGLSINKLDKIIHYDIKGNPNDQSSILRHYATQGEVKIRNRKNGDNVCWMGNFCLVLICQFWEDEFRKEIAKEIGYHNKNQLTLNVMGEIRNYRNAIIHHKSKATKKVESNNILTWFKKGDPIMIDEQKMEKIIDAIANELKELKDSKGNKLLTKNIFPNERTHRSIFDVN